VCVCEGLVKDSGYDHSPVDTDNIGQLSYKSLKLLKVSGKNQPLNMNSDMSIMGFPVFFFLPYTKHSQ